MDETTVRKRVAFLSLARVGRSRRRFTARSLKRWFGRRRVSVSSRAGILDRSFCPTILCAHTGRCQSRTTCTFRSASQMIPTFSHGRSLGSCRKDRHRRQRRARRQLQRHVANRHSLERRRRLSAEKVFGHLSARRKLPRHKGRCRSTSREPASVHRTTSSATRNGR